MTLKNRTRVAALGAVIIASLGIAIWLLNASEQSARADDPEDLDYTYVDQTNGNTFRAQLNPLHEEAGMFEIGIPGVGLFSYLGTDELDFPKPLIAVRTKNHPKTKPASSKNVKKTKKK